MYRTPASRHVTPRDVWTVLWVVLLTAGVLFVLFEIKRILIWLFVAVFFAAVISPLVSRLERRGVRRGLAVLIVTLGLLIVGGIVTYLFVKPLLTQSIQFAQDLPSTVDRLQRAPLIRQAVERFNLEDRLTQTQADLPQRLAGLSGPLIGIFRGVGQALLALVTILVMTVFLLLYGPRFIDTGMALMSEHPDSGRVRRLGRESLSSISGWVAGNVATSIVAATAAIVTFLIVGIPYGALLALWVGVADLIPLVGATLGALPAILVAFFHSPVAGIAVTVFFAVYQQFENHVLQPAVYSRTIQLNPFLVLLAVLIGVELLGFVGALVALPVAGVVQIVVLDVARTKGIGPGEDDPLDDDAGPASSAPAVVPR